MSGILTEIKGDKSRPFRRAYIKRRLLSSGLFESSWQEITDDVKKWGKIVQQIDSTRPGRIQFSANTIQVANDDGRYNPSTNENSLWYGYASQQRTLIKFQAGFKAQTLGADGIYVNDDIGVSYWDASYFDESLWDDTGDIFYGVIVGDVNLSSSNDINLKVMPLSQLFRDYPAKLLSGWTSTGMAASDFVEMVRDHSDSNGAYIFRPFFNDTTSNWNIETTTSVYVDLNTSGAKDVIESSVWDVMEKLAEAENFTMYIDNTGMFNFISKDSIQATTSYEFHGVGSTDRDYGIQIKGIDFFGFRQSKYYSRVQVKHTDSDTTTSYETYEATLQVAGENGPWNYGHRTLYLENYWMNSATAQSIASALFVEVSSYKQELVFSTSFVPHLNLNDRLGITYDANPISKTSLWDLNEWADTSGAAETGLELIWDPFTGNPISLLNDEYKPLSIEVDLDNLSTRIVAKEV